MIFCEAIINDRNISAFYGRIIISEISLFL